MLHDRLLVWGLEDPDGIVPAQGPVETEVLDPLFVPYLQPFHVLGDDFLGWFFPEFDQYYAFHFRFLRPFGHCTMDRGVISKFSR